METALWLLLAYCCVATVDGTYNHLHTLRLYAHPESRTEHLLHTLLGLGTAATVVLLVFVELGPLGFAALIGIQAITIVLTFLDVRIEPQSRASMGGLPPSEYVIHTAIFLLHGAFVWSLFAGRSSLSAGRGFGAVRWPDLPPLVALVACGLAAGAAWAFVVHVYLFRTGGRAALAYRDGTGSAAVLGGRTGA